MMYFYLPGLSNGENILKGDEYLHCVKVLRHKEGDKIGILDGKGTMAISRISQITSSKCFFEIVEQQSIQQKDFYCHIAISPTKSIDRMEWFVEKACELGVDEITFLQTRNSERNKLRVDRLQKKAISALKQSKSGFLTKLNDLVPWNEFLKRTTSDKKFIAVVEENLPYFTEVIDAKQHVLITIGPEGDFDPSEVSDATKKGFIKVGLGKNTLRTETAGVVTAQMVNTINKY